MTETTSFLRVFALWAAGLGAAAQYGKMSVIFDLLPGLYPQAGASLGFLVSLVGSVGILLGVVAGLMVARIRYRRALLSALWLGAGVSVFQALTPGFGWMLTSRVVEGLSHLAIVVAAPTLIAQLSAPKDRGFTLTLWGTFFGVAFAILALAGRPLALSLGLPALFAAHALYMAACALVLAASLRRLPSEEPQPPFSLPQIFRDHLTIYRSPFLSAPAAGWLFYTFSFVSILTVLPPYLDEAWRAPVMAAMPLTSIAVSMTLGVLLLRRLPAVQVVQMGFGLSALSMAWLWLSPGAPLACIALAGAMGLIQGASFTAVPQLNQGAAAQAQANGAVAQMGNLGNSIGTPIMAFGLATLGASALPLLAGGAFLMGLGAHVLLAAARRRSRRVPV
ncbi:MFS transporter [Sulfitobacter delicatus]|uniref:Predicted arabinose efflux permease, MFS family n=1 Tax=Sulfitobacter delicatus TaxID=218672 RepID=A0A1G7PPJ6_9RHOB|nr:MFS transporter [Sulfitobacter delicatus]SDF88193.1 Predicted arabinose efflux permease, MFS family [Sulfitobacter delicatus]